MIEVLPFKGVGKLKLGMSKEEIRKAVGSPADNIPAHTSSGIAFQESDYFLESSIQVTYDQETGQANWIAINNNISSKVIFEEMDLFNSSVQDVVTHTESFGALDNNDSELGYSYTFPSLGLSFWRSSITEDLLQELAITTDEEDKECLIQDIEKSKYFEQISIAVRGYGESTS
ncbi:MULTISPECIES: hypothetical protein [unclassified Vibrio]|nr:MULTISPECIES: hypothetical protein [unclassified Vibrio]NAX42326.1 hypothetical protein [Vibrio sp. V25_P4S6T154]OXX60564.1 hypothetical protein B9J89_17215 [Vibrio sp. V15_P4S5T153]OXX68275.1 hypothetical protein B9J94_08550 [Vibrio sp. V20_P4S3T152]